MTGYYESLTQVAASCPSGCSNCLSPSFCSLYANGYFLRNGACLQTCPQRFFGQSSSNSCEACPYDCLTCSTIGANCLSCSPSDFRSLDSALGRCLPVQGYYEKGTQICPPMPYRVHLLRFGGLLHVVAPTSCRLTTCATSTVRRGTSPTPPRVSAPATATVATALAPASPAPPSSTSGNSPAPPAAVSR
jgi:hypothetical protein